MIDMKKLILPDDQGNEQEFEIIDASARSRLDAHDSAIAGKADTADVSLLTTLVVDITSISALPMTINNANITNDMVVINSVLSNPSAQSGDWTVTTSNGSLTVSGTISGTTDLKLYLNKSR